MPYKCAECKEVTSGPVRGNEKDGYQCWNCEVKTRPGRFHCLKCNALDDQSRTMCKLDGFCFTCRFWQEKVEWNSGSDRQRKPENLARIAGRHYVIHPDTGKMSWRGFGGQKFKIKFHDGRIVETTNLWHQGEIPKNFRDELPDNAEFIE